MATDGQQRFPAPDSSGRERGGQDSLEQGSGGHYDLATLADFDAEACDPAVEEKIRVHTAGCAECEAVLDELRALRVELATLPAPQPPASVTARLDAALDAERQARFGASPPRHRRYGTGGTAPAAFPPEPPHPSVVRLDTARGRRAPRWLGWAAAAVVLLGGSGAVLGMQASLGGGSDTAARSNNPVTEGAGAGSRPTPLLGGQVPAQGSGQSDDATTTRLPTYTRADIGDHLATILSQAYCGDSGGCSSNSAGAMADTDRRSRCTATLREGHGMGGVPRAVQSVLFEGTPAFVFVFDDNRMVVVGANCGDSPRADILFADH